MPAWPHIQAFGKKYPPVVFGVLALIYLFTASGRVGLADSSRMLEVTRALLEGHVSLPENAAAPIGPDGRAHSQFGLLTSLYWMPFVLLARVAGTLAPGVPLAMLEEFFVSFSGVPLVLLLLGYLAWEWRSRALEEIWIRRGLWMIGLTTLIWPYAKIASSDLLFALTMLAAWCHGRRAVVWRHAVAGGLFLGLGLLCRKQAQTVIPVILLFMLLHPPRTELRRVLGGVMTGFVPPLLVHLAYNYARWGSPFLEVYAFSNAETPRDVVAWIRMLSYNLLGPYQGFFLFSPALLLLLVLCAKPWWQAERWEMSCLSLLMTGQLLLLAYFGPALGPISFGARLLLFMVPLFALGWPYWARQASRMKNRVLVVFAAAGLIVQLLGVTIDPLAAWKRRELSGSDEPILLAHAAELVRVLGAPVRPVEPAGSEALPYSRHPAFQCPDFWWMHLYHHWSHKEIKLADEP